jgi:hypothetical protein
LQKIGAQHWIRHAPEETRKIGVRVVINTFTESSIQDHGGRASKHIN